MVYARCFDILGKEEDAQEAFQETWIKVQVYLGKFMQVESKVSWLYKVTTNTCLNILRTKRRKYLADWSDPEVVSSHSCVENEADSILSLREVFFYLPKDLRSIALYYFRDRMTQDEIAQVTKTSRATVVRKLRKINERIENMRAGSDEKN